jgi:hypothetical protein
VSERVARHQNSVNADLIRNFQGAASPRTMSKKRAAPFRGAARTRASDAGVLRLTQPTIHPNALVVRKPRKR